MNRAACWTLVALAPPCAGSFAWAQATELVSVTSSGVQANASSFLSSVSGDGRCVAFESFASNLVAGDTNGSADVFVRDRSTATTERVSVGTGGSQGNGSSRFPSISADGRFVAFESEAPNLVAGDTNGVADIFVRDRQVGTTERVSVGTGGSQGNSASGRPSISADGRFVSFESSATNLVATDTNAAADVFVRDRQGGTTVRASVTTGGAQANGFSRNAVISADGRCVAFEGFSTNLVAGDTNGSADVFLRDLQLGTTERVSLTAGGAQANLASLQPRISADGRFVAFLSGASNLVAGDTNGWSDVFVRDRRSGATERVSVSTSGAQGDFHSLESAISADGRIVAFWSFASTLVPGNTGVFGRVFVHDRELGTTQLASVSTGGVPANSGSSEPSISADGRYVAFYSDASNLVASDVNATDDIFLHDRGHDAFTSFCAGDGTANACPCDNDGASGSGCGNSLFPTGATLSGSGLASISQDTVTLSAANLTGTFAVFFQGDTALAPAAIDDGLGCVGGTIVRLGTKGVAQSSAAYPGAGDPAISTLAALPLAGGTYYYQCLYRDPAAGFCSPASSNRTNGVVIRWIP